MPLLRKLVCASLICLALGGAQSGHAASLQGTTHPDQPQYKLEAIATPNPVYPAQAREQKVEGEVIASLLVSETGDVKNMQIVKGDPLLGKSVEDAVAKWTFKPVIKGNKAIPVIAVAKFRFTLSDDNQASNGVPPELGAGSDFPLRVRVSSKVIQELLVRSVQPAYPSDARRAHIQGVVLLHAIISKEGQVSDLQLISGPKELAHAAIEAVRQWRYKPYLLLGQPVEIDAQIQVNFTLSN